MSSYQQRRSSISTSVLVLVLVTSLTAEEKPTGAQQEPAAAEAGTVANKDQAIAHSAETDRPMRVLKRIDPKPLAEHTKQGLAYLASQQQDNGGWGQGGGWRINRDGGGRINADNAQDRADVGNTCIATLALLRSGSTPTRGPYATQINKAFQFINQHVQGSDEGSLYVTDIRDTQLQSKIGQYVDTFLAAWVFSELKGQMPSERTEKRLLASLNKTVKKIEKNQQDDGTFAGNRGWASVLSLGICSKALNRAQQNGVAVPTEVLDRDFQQARAGLNVRTGEFAGATELAAARTRAVSSRSGGVGGAAPASDAGVQIYNYSANTGRLNDYMRANARRASRARGVLRSKLATEEDKERAQEVVDQMEGAALAQKSAVEGIAKKLDDKNFIRGFGNNGGEEFLSYMNISETLFTQDADRWTDWSKSVNQLLAKSQNNDGSWSGQHCITGRTFCTSAALLTLMADRAPVGPAILSSSVDNK